MTTLHEYLSNLRIRPGMYLGSRSITKLREQMLGYRLGVVNNECVSESDKRFFDNFTDYVMRYYEIEKSARDWSGIILEQCSYVGDKEELALSTFFELYDKFNAGELPTTTKRNVMSLLDKIAFRQEELKSGLGDSYDAIVAEVINQIKGSCFTNLKYDYDFVIDRLNKKAEETPALLRLLDEIAKEPI